MTASCPTLRPHARHPRVIGARAVALVVSSFAVAMALAAGAAAPAAARDRHAAPAPAAAAVPLDGTIAANEAAVAASPRDAGLRAALGHAYLRAGRFESAAAALDGAQTLGDSSSRTVLGLALAQIATGHGRDAVVLLDAARDQLPVADLGLALALAGDTGRGVAVLTEALKAGAASQTLRQNLAYADALDGRWADARMLATMDLPADKVDARLTQWASTARPEAYRDRVAALLNAPLREDAGLPANLALTAAAAGPALAANAAPTPPAPDAAGAAAANPAPAGTDLASAAPAAAAPLAPRTDAAGELPATAAAADLAAAPLPPAPLPAAPAAPATPADAMAANRLAETAPAPAAPVVVAALPAPSPAPRHGRHAARRAAALASAAAATPAAPGADTGGTHVVQIGAFLSQANAERARRAFARHNPYPGHSLALTQATVNGKQFWRVTVAGFAAAQAGDACGTLKKHGSACFAYAADRAPGGEALAMATPLPGHGRHR